MGMISVDDLLQKHNEYVVSVVDEAHDLDLLPGYDEMRSLSDEERTAHERALSAASKPIGVNIFDDDIV